MNIMDEITYWVYTKRAPCLMNYDNLVKKQNEVAQTSKQCKSEHSVTEEAPSPKKKKRKLALLVDECVSGTRQQSVYFETSLYKQPKVLKSDSLESDIDFNIKKSSIQEKPKKVKVQKNGRTLHKKNKIATSTPLRRSLRKAQNCVNNNEQLNISCETFNCSLIKENNAQSQAKTKSKKSAARTPEGDRTLDKKREALPNETKNETALNGQFDDLSDVSGFTANYIRSTKINSNAKPRKNLRTKNCRNLIRESQKKLQENGTTMLVCVNKSVNATTEAPNASFLNCSTDSSQNVINLITTKNNENNNLKVDRSTSLLKFVDAKSPKVKDSDSSVKLDSSKLISNNVDISVENKNSRYPKRHKNHSSEDVSSACNLVKKKFPNNRKTVVMESNILHRKENPTDSSLSRTRSGRNLALAARQSDNAVLVFSNSTEQVSSLNTVNVASQPGEGTRRKPKNKRLSPPKYNRKTMDKSGVSLKDSVREKSGFAACFSDSDDDSEALKQRKFFC